MQISRAAWRAGIGIMALSASAVGGGALSELAEAIRLDVATAGKLIRVAGIRAE